MGHEDQSHSSTGSAAPSGGAPVAPLSSVSDCGNKLETFCTSCGKENAETATFCFACGNRILRPHSSQSPVPHPTAPQPSTPRPQTPQKPTKGFFRRLSPWWFGYFGYSVIITIALQNRLKVPLEVQPQSVTRPLGYLFELLGIAISLMALPAFLVILYVCVKAIACRSFKIRVFTRGLIAFLTVSTTILAALTWLGATR